MKNFYNWCQVYKNILNDTLKFTDVFPKNYNDMIKTLGLRTKSTQKLRFLYDIYTSHENFKKYMCDLNIYKEFVHRKINTKILAPIHNNTFLKDSSYKSKLNFYVTRYPKNTRKLFKFYNQTITDLYLKIYKPDILHKTFYEKNLNL